MAARRKRIAQAPHGAERPGAYSSPACYLHEFESGVEPPAAHGFEIKRVYDKPERTDGYRVLVDRLWPRGLSKDRAVLDEWRADLAPSTALRQWYHRDVTRWAEFGARYRAELRAHSAQLQALRTRARAQRVTLVYASRDPQLNHAVVLRDVLRKSPRARRPAALP